MLHSVLSAFGSSVESASAHCDVPCKIYDPNEAQLAAQSVVRMMDILAETAEKEDGIAKSNTITRAVMVKEEEAAKCKAAVAVIWGDYFKAPQIEQFPNIHELAHSIMLAGSAAKVGTDRELGVKLNDLVNEFAAAFFATKGIKTETKKAPYLPNLPIVVPVLDDA